MDDREHAIRQDERVQTLMCVLRAVRHFYEDRGMGEVHGDDLLDEINQAVRTQMPRHVPGAA